MMNGKPAEMPLSASENTVPGTNGTVSARQRLGPMIILAWLMLLYTGLMGAFPEARSLLVSQLNVLPGFNLAHWLPGLPGINTHYPESHSLCLFRQLIGLPCVFCGATRSFILLSLGHWQASLHYHLLGIPFYLSTLFLATFGLFRPEKTLALLAWLQDKRVIAAILALLLTCWLWKLGQNPVFW
jgi:hypothetical protein